MTGRCHIASLLQEHRQEVDQRTRGDRLLDKFHSTKDRPVCDKRDNGHHSAWELEDRNF